MLVYVWYFMIFVGVTVALYQVYSIHYNLNFEDEEERSGDLNTALKELSEKVNEYKKTGSRKDFAQCVQRIFGSGFDHRLVLEAFDAERTRDFAEPLLRRKNNIVTNGGVKIAHFPFWVSRPPENNLRGALLLVIVVNSLLVLFWGAMSLYTVAYPVSVEAFSWVNNVFFIMLVVYFSIFVTFLLSKLDVYMHDVYQIGKLNKIAREG